MKYKNFRMVARVLEVMAWVAGLGMLVLGLITGFTGEGAAAIIVGIIFGVIGGLVTFILLYAMAQFIYVLLDIERNTRATVRALYEETETEEKSDTVTEMDK